MRLAHVSDLHLGLADIAPGGGRPASDVAKAIARDLHRISDGLDLIVVSGDLTERAEADSFAEFEELFGQIDLPILVIPGNHDGPAGMQAYTETSGVFAEWNITNRAVTVGGTHFVGLDTCIEGAIEGALDEAGLALIAEEVARDTESRLVIVMHHPPLLLGLEQYDGFCRLEGRARLMDLLHSAERTVTILSGHVHRPYRATQGNVACFVAGSMVAPYDSARPFGDHPIRPAMMQDFYDVHDFGPGGHHVVTPQRVRDLTG